MHDLNLRAWLLVIPVVTGLLALWVSRRERRRVFIQQRLAAFTPGSPAARPSLLRAVSHTTSSVLIDQLFTRGMIGRLHVEFASAGNGVGYLHLLIAGLIAAIIMAGFTIRIFALGLSVVIPLVIIAAVLAAFMLLRIAQSRYQNRFLDLFPDGLDLIGRAIKAGLPVNEALVVAGKEMADPVGRELRHALDQVQLGTPLIEALQKTADRIRIADFRFMVVALALQQRSGGSLAETLANLSKVIRARKQLRLKARGLSAEAKMSAIVLAILPFFVGGALSFMNPDLAHVLFFDPRGRFMVGLSSISLLTGLSIMYVMIKRAVR